MHYSWRPLCIGVSCPLAPTITIAKDDEEAKALLTKAMLAYRIETGFSPLSFAASGLVHLALSLYHVDREAAIQYAEAVVALLKASPTDQVGIFAAEKKRMEAFLRLREIYGAPGQASQP